MLIAYENEGKIITQSFADSATVVTFPHVVIDRDIPEPIESWYLEDGQIKIDRVKLKQIERERMRRLTLIEFATVLDAHGLLEAVEDYMTTQAPLLTRIAYQRASFISRTDPMLEEVASTLKISPDQVDSMWLTRPSS